MLDIKKFGFKGFVGFTMKGVDIYVKKLKTGEGSIFYAYVCFQGCSGSIQIYGSFYLLEDIDEMEDCLFDGKVLTQKELEDVLQMVLWRNYRELTEEEKCAESPYYFATNYLQLKTESGFVPFTTRLSEKDFNAEFKNLQKLVGFVFKDSRKNNKQ